MGCGTPGPIARHPNDWRTAEPPDAIAELLNQFGPAASTAPVASVSQPHQPQAGMTQQNQQAVQSGNALHWRCPKCGDSNIQRVSVIYAEGTSSASRTTVGVGDIQGEGLIGGVGASSQTGSTGLAAQLAPPREPKSLSNDAAGTAGCLAFVVFALVFFLTLIIDSAMASDDEGLFSGLCLFFLNPAVAGFVFARLTFRKVKTSGDAEYLKKVAEHQKEQADFELRRGLWERSFFCHRCGDIFELASP